MRRFLSLYSAVSLYDHWLFRNISMKVMQANINILKIRKLKSVGGVDRRSLLRPIAVEMIAVEMIAVEAIAVETIAVKMIAVEAITVETITIEVITVEAIVSCVDPGGVNQ